MPDYVIPMPPPTPPPPPGQVEHGGKRFVLFADGTMLPVELVKSSDSMRDDFVRENVGGAEEICAALAAFKAKVFDQADVLLEVLASQYRIVLGGKKGNVLFESLDGTLRVQIAVADRLTFGAEMQIAKAGIDELLGEWGEKTPAEVLALVQYAFRTNKDGELSPGKLLGLKRIDIRDERWARAMQAITDSMRVVGTKRHVRFHKRPSAEDAWEAIHTSLSDV